MHILQRCRRRWKRARRAVAFAPRMIKMKINPEKIRDVDRKAVR